MLNSPRQRPDTRALMTALHRRAYDRLERAFVFPVTVVCARAGYDRTIVVREALQRCGFEYRFVEVDVATGDIIDFVRALARALRDDVPALAASFVAVCDRLGGSDDAFDQLAAWTASCLEAFDGTVVVDAHGIEHVDPRVMALVSALVDRTPETVGWIVICETSAHLPVARWLAEGRIDLPIDESDLIVTETDLFALAGAVPALRRRRLAAVCDLTGGWPAAVALSIAATREVELVPDRCALYERLAEAVFEELAISQRAFVEATVLFGNFDGAILECAGLLDVAPAIERLQTDGVLDAVDSGVFRYDELFAAFVIARIRSRGEAAFRAAATNAAGAYVRDGRFAAAIALYLTLSDARAVADLLGAHGFELMDRGESTIVARALNDLPHADLAAFPRALAVKAAFESLHGKFDVAEAWFRHALDVLPDDERRGEIVYRFAIDLVRRERTDAIDILLPLVSTMPPDAPLAAPLSALLATAYAFSSQFDRAARAIERALMLLPRLTGQPGMRARVLHQAAFVALRISDLATAKTLSLKAYAEASACYNFDVAARALSVLYNIALDHDDDVPAARDYLIRLADLGLRAGSRELLLYATLCRYELEVTSGNVPQIAALDERLQSLEMFFSVLVTETLLPAQALQAAWSGDFHRAYRLLQWTGEHQIDPDRRAFRYSEIAVYAAAAGLREAACAAADEALSIVRRLRAVNAGATATLSYVVLTFVLLRHSARAAKLLAELTQQAGDGRRGVHFVRVVERVAARWAGACEPDELAAALDGLRGHELGGLARMVEALPLPETARSRLVRLNPGERDLLQRLSWGQTPRDIAALTGRRPARIAAQVRSLCRKLGCEDRQHAVALARSERLVHEAADDPRERAARR